ncbi:MULTISPECIES: hypothetical protein [unclassified Microbacterium]|uniref:hypothetical protein n=1 Tax=unclassified Microbacterium TaxID=2609290 RepID=UPI00301819E4
MTEHDPLAPTDWDDAPLPDEVAAHPLLAMDSFGIAHAWNALRDSGRSPLDVSPIRSTHQSRAEFLVGAWALDKLVPPRLGGSLLGNLQPQMLHTADVLAAERFVNAILEPRRSAKTTSVWCVLIGRCWMRPVYMAGYTMLTTAKKANERFKLDVRDPILRKWRDKRDRPLKVNESNGSMGLEFANGSKLAILSPNGDDVRSGAYDILVMDEGGEAEPDMWDDIVGAVVPSFDTRGDGAQLVYAGTGGHYREGSHFWAALHDPDAGRIRYGVPDDFNDDALASWDSIGPLIDAIHPGLDGLTTLEQIKRNYHLLGPARFGLEYCGHFGRAAGNDTAVSLTAWERTRLDAAVPTGITPMSLAFAVHPGGAWASIAVAWLLDAAPGDLVAAANALEGDDAPPRMAVKIVHHQQGNARLEYTLRDLARTYRLPVTYDNAPQERAIVERLQRIARPRPRVNAMTMADKSVATAALLNGIEHGTIDHWAQAELDAAAALAVYRPGKMRLLGVPDDSDPTQEITPLEAAAAAVHALPTAAPAAPFSAIVVAN